MIFGVRDDVLVRELFLLSASLAELAPIIYIKTATGESVPAERRRKRLLTIRWYLEMSCVIGRISLPNRRAMVANLSFSILVIRRSSEANSIVNRGRLRCTCDGEDT